MKNLLVTGGAGFIGSNFIHYLIKKHPKYLIVNLDLLTYAGNIYNLSDLEDDSRHIFVHGDIADYELVKKLIQNYKIDTIVNFAAESHVDRSILRPDMFIKTNIIGTQTLLGVAKEEKIEKYLQISTDEVYGDLGKQGYFTENSMLAPNSPYAASKASADLLVRSYIKTYGLNANITRCSNNYGPYQFPEKLIPLFVTNGLLGKELPLYGDGQNIRDWLHVYDHCHALDLVLHKAKAGEIYNIGGHNERTNTEIAHLIVEKLGLSKTQIKHVTDRLGHDRRYAIDPTKIRTELSWEPTYTFEKGINETINWYLKNQNWWRPLKNQTKVK